MATVPAPVQRTTSPLANGTRTTATPYRIDSYTPPQGQPGQRSWLGIDPSSRISVDLARQGLSGYLGGDVGQHAESVASILRQNGYTDPTFSQDLTGEQYNALLQAGAQATGNMYTPWSTTAPMSDPDPQPTPPPAETPENPGTQGGPPPALVIPEYQRRGDFSFTPDDLKNDAGYNFEFNEGMRALQNSAAARGGMRGTNTMRDMVSFGQGLAATGLDRAFARASGTWDRNVGEDRYAHEAASNRAQVQYAPQLLNWERNRDERRRDIESDRAMAWDREQYGRDDAWRRHVYANDDVWRRYQLEENRRLALANGGRV